MKADSAGEGRVRLPTRTLLLGGILGPAIFVGSFLVEGAMRSGYDPDRHLVSLLGLGEGGWIEDASFIVSGVLVGAFGLGLMRLWRRRLAGPWIARIVVAVGIGLIALGIFLTDPAQGYPPGSVIPPPDAITWLPSSPTWHAVLHFAASAVVFVGLAVAGVLTAFRGTRWRGPAARAWTVASVLTAIIVLVGWVASFLGDGSGGPPANAGLLQRVSVVAAMQWLVVTAVSELRSSALAAGSTSRIDGQQGA